MRLASSNRDGAGAPASAAVDRRRVVAVRIALVGALALVLLIAPRVSIEALPPPPLKWSFRLSFAQRAAGTWETAPLPAQATVAGLSWTGSPPERAWVRASENGENWTEWTELLLDGEHGPDPTSAEAEGAKPASEPVYLGRAEFVQYRIQGASHEGLQAEVVETAGRQLGTLQRLALVVRGIRLSEPEDAEAAPGAPDFITREEWGADTCATSPPDTPEYVDRVRIMFVHHTATANGYSEADAPEVIRSICAYHVFTQGWDDIAYNFLIDAYGNTYEGRGGGVTEQVYGAHTKGFNFYSSGVALIGEHSFSAPSSEALESLNALMAWKLDIHHVDPTGSSEVMSLGSELYDFGEVVELPDIAGHRDAQVTSCPGDACYLLLPSIRPQVEARGGDKIFLGFPAREPAPYGDRMEWRLRFSSEMNWAFRLYDRSGTTVLLSDSGTGTQADIVWNRKRGGAYVEPGWYPLQVEATTLDGATPRQVSTATLVFRPPFVDDDGSVHEFSIVDIAEAGITEGCGGDFYCPADSVTRGQMASFITRALDLPPSPSDWFDDDDDSVHDEAIDSIAEAGITLGFPNGTFRPNLAVTRGQMASFIARALDLADSTEDWFSDDNGNPHEANINKIADAGITVGCSEGRFCPLDSVSRGQMASFLARGFIE